MAFAGNVLRGSSGDSTLQMLEGRTEGKIAQGRQEECGWMISKVDLN